MKIVTNQGTYESDDVKGFYKESDTEMVVMVGTKTHTLTGESVAQFLSGADAAGLRVREYNDETEGK